MAESDFAKRLDDDMPKCFGKLHPISHVEEVEWHEAHNDERGEQDHRKVLHVTVVEFRCQLDHGDLPSEAREPDKREDEGDPVELVVNELVVLIDLKDEGVVNVEPAEDLNCEAHRKQHKADHCCENIGVHSRIDLVPVFPLRCWAYREEQEKGKKHDEPSTKEAHQITIFASYIVVLSVELCLCLSQIAFAETISVEC